MVGSFYLVLTIVGFLWHAVAQGHNDVWGIAGPKTWLIAGPALGVVLGLAVVGLFRRLEVRSAWVGELQREFADLLGPMEHREVLLLAMASAIGEEVLFRGAMLDAWGLVATTIAFGLLHIPRRLGLWRWTASALALGGVLGAITLATGNLGAAIVAHFVINYLNLRKIAGFEPLGLRRQRR